MTDLGHKIIIQNTVFKSFDGSELIILTAIVNALILLPFILLFLPAGKISDRYYKPRVIRFISLGAIIITSGILISYYQGWFWLAFALTLVLAAQSAIYSPAKYGLLKELFASKHLTKANGVVQAITITSILLGALVYSLFFELLLANRSQVPNEIIQYIAPIGFLLVLSSCLEFYLANYLLKVLPEYEHRKVPVKVNEVSLSKNFRLIKSKVTIWYCILGLSIFWGVSQTVVALFAAFFKENLHITNTIVAQGLLSLSGVGIICGSLLVSKLSRQAIDLRIVPLGALGLSSTLFLLPALESLWQSAVLIFLYGLSSGLYIVPLNALMQFASPKAKLGQVLSTNNLVQNLIMLAFLSLMMILAFINIPSKVLLFAVGIFAFIATAFILTRIPQSLLAYHLWFYRKRGLVSKDIQQQFKAKVLTHGLDNIESEQAILLLGEVKSISDCLALQCAYPEKIRFFVCEEFPISEQERKLLQALGAIFLPSTRSDGNIQTLAQVFAEIKNSGQSICFLGQHMASQEQVKDLLSNYHGEFALELEQSFTPIYFSLSFESEISQANQESLGRTFAPSQMTTRRIDFLAESPF